ncbi:hypothetical protein BHE74_00002400 [Ensete ventricosum]|nr:hypothetical protein BHE74_00002400 [Ensete ventricosum]
MATAMALVVVFLLASGVGLSEGAVYKVGDSAGWTLLGNPNYTAWALSKNFQVGDTIGDEKSPIATYATGNDSITLKTKGHHYFLCGIPGHCTAGQKVDIKVSSCAAPTTSPAPSPSSASPATPPSSGGGGGGGGGGSGGSGGGVSTPGAAPGASAGTRAVPGGIALRLAVLSFTAMYGGLVWHY